MNRKIQCGGKLVQMVSSFFLRINLILNSLNYFFYPILKFMNTDCCLVYGIIINSIAVILKFLLFPLFSLGFSGYKIIKACQNRTICYSILFVPIQELVFLYVACQIHIIFLFIIQEYKGILNQCGILAISNLLYLTVCIAVRQQSFVYKNYYQKKYTKECFSQYCLEQSEQEFEFLNKQILKTSQTRSNLINDPAQQQHQNSEIFIDDMMYLPSLYNLQSFFKRVNMKGTQQISNMRNQENTDEDIQPEIDVEEKQWNHFFQLMDVPPKLSTLLKVMDLIIQLLTVIGSFMSIILIQITINSKQKQRYLLLEQIINIIYWLLFYFIMRENIGDILRYIDTINIFTFLLERVESLPQKNRFIKYHTTINLYCIRSMRTWIEMRCFYFQELKNNLKKHNQFQLIEIIMIFFTILIMFFDYFGTFWERSYFLNSSYILIMICFTTIYKFVACILPAFIAYCEGNQNIQQSRTLILQFISHLISLKSFIRKEVKEEAQKQFDEQLNQLVYEHNQLSIEIPQYDQFQIIENNQNINKQGINEIKRNTCIYRYYRSKNDQQAELEYIDDLMKMYENINLRLEDNKANHVFKYLGLIEISYSKLPALIYFFIPMIFQIYNYYLKQ